MCKTAIMANVRNAGGATGPLRVAGRESRVAGRAPLRMRVAARCIACFGNKCFT